LRCGFQGTESTSDEVDGGAAFVDADDFADTPIGQGLIGVVGDVEFADDLLADGERDGFGEVQKDAASAHIDGDGVDDAAIGGDFDGSSGLDGETGLSASF